MNKQQLFENIKKKQSFLCVGLDTDIKKIPEHLLKEEDPIFAFNKAISDATAPYCIAYKPNLAFYESMGVKGWISFEKTIQYLNENYPDQFIIADAKRGDIGNTSAMYARTFFEEINLDAVTVAPYMGEDSVTPFLTYEGKWVILLALTPLCRRWLTILPLGGDTARAVGMAITPSRVGLLLLAAGLTATATMTIGPLSFVGLMAPHIARMMGFRRAMPHMLISALAGGVLLVFADWCGRMVPDPGRITVDVYWRAVLYLSAT